MTTCEWVTGKPGRGKSHYAFVTCMEKYGGYSIETAYDWNLEETFQTYNMQKVVIINEYKGPHEIRYGTLLKMIDKWPFWVKVKGKDPVPFVAEHVIITSIFRPEETEWKMSAKVDSKAVQRMISREGGARRGHANGNEKCYGWIRCGFTRARK